MSMIWGPWKDMFIYRCLDVPKGHLKVLENVTYWGPKNKFGDPKKKIKFVGMLKKNYY